MSTGAHAVLPAVPAASLSPELRFLQLAARLLLEYNFRSEVVKALLTRTAEHLGVPVLVYVAYRGVTLHTHDGHQYHAQAKELRNNVVVSVRASRIVDQVSSGALSIAAGTAALESLEREPPQRDRRIVLFTFALAAAALARLLRADVAAVLVSGVAAALGLVVRQELGRRHWMSHGLPVVGALVSAMVAGFAIRFDATATPGLCFLVPFLMLVPGPHLINGVFDIAENHMQTGLSRLSLATVMLIGAALGVLLGARLTLGTMPVVARPSDAVQLTFLHDVVLAGIASCGFGVFYNSPWRILSVAILSGMIGHGTRFLCLQFGMSLETSTFVACLPIGAMAGFAVAKIRVPFAAIAFAGAVPMLPGAFIYKAITGALAIAQAGDAAGQPLIAGTVASIFRATFVVGAMAVSLMAGGWLAGMRRPRYWR